MSEIKVTFTQKIPEASPDDIEEWLNYNLKGGEISCDNALYSEELSATRYSLDWRHV